VCVCVCVRVRMRVRVRVRARARVCVCVSKQMSEENVEQRRMTLRYYIMSNIDIWRSYNVTVVNLKVLQ